jgi:hypothetical protein
MNPLLFVIGLVIVLLTMVNVLFTLVLPRKVVGVGGMTLAVNRTVRLAFIGLSRLATSYERKDSILAATAPVALIAQLLVWAVTLTLGFGLMLAAGPSSYGGGLLQSLTALFTVGAVHIGGRPDSGIDIAVGAMWVVIVALQIAYLPAIYGAFSRREGLVALLESRAGEPAWGPELLVRHQLVGIIDTIPGLYADWEEWSADVAESHTTYPILLLFRSPEPWLSWLVGLLAVLDAGAMHLALAPSTAPSQARLCLRMGFTLLHRIATSLGWPVDPDPDPDGDIQLTFEEFAQAVAMLEGSGFPTERSADEAWADFKGWRVNYESVAYRLADRLTAPPAPWSGRRRHLATGVVEPRRPPQRRPGGGSSFSYERPTVVNPDRRRRRSRDPDAPET